MDAEIENPTFSLDIRSSNGSANTSECASNNGEENEIRKQRKKIVVVGLGMIALSFMCDILPPNSGLFGYRRISRDIRCNTIILTSNKREINQIGFRKSAVRYCRDRRRTSCRLQPGWAVDLF